MDDRRQHRRYLAAFLATAVVLALGTAFVNYRIDPYGIFGSPRTPGFNALKPASHERVRITKPYQAERAQPRTVIGGNSRPELGLDPDSPCWAAADRPIFNAGIPGASFRLQASYAKHALLQGRGSQLLMGVDLADFLIDRRRTYPSAQVAPVTSSPPLSSDEQRLAPQLTGAGQAEHLQQRTADRLTALFSLTTLGDSLATVAAQGNPDAATRLENGFNPARDFYPIVRSEGQHVLFEQKNQEITGLFGRPGLAIHDASGRAAPAFADLRGLLAWAKVQGIRVTLFINPYHVDYLATIYRAGLWPEMEAWKRELTAIAEQHNTPLWDFNTVDEYSTEPPPPRGDTRSMLRWFVEPAHYRSELGEKMIASMQGQTCDAVQGKAQFGVSLREAGLSNHLDALRAALVAHVEELR
tara:strand:- start:4715 stop:5953 length:1239 start_codon:yes stop_codon:yes gene_type:complete